MTDNREKILEIVRYLPAVELKTVYGRLTHQIFNEINRDNEETVLEIHRTLVDSGWIYSYETMWDGSLNHIYYRPGHNEKKPDSEDISTLPPDAIGLEIAATRANKRAAAEVPETINAAPDAPQILAAAAEAIANRAASRDLPAERSMARTVAAFNTLTGHILTETQGWLFMAVLKAARSTAGKTEIDDYIDGASYFALAGESASGGKK